MEDATSCDNENIRDMHDSCRSEVVVNKIKKYKPGIIYIPNFPQFMTIMKAKEIFGQFGEITKTYFQPKVNKGRRGKKEKPSIHFSEGWIEFKSKRVAKEVALRMNNTLVGGKKRSKYYDCLWNIKYLSGFKWIHLNERLAYEKAVRRHKLKKEIVQAKKEVSIFASNIERSKKLSKLSNQEFNNEYIQRQTESEILAKKEENEIDRTNFLKSLFAN